ncbi:MAG: hypothetical protein IH614_19720 [Desulfuromonadales bacterium]|nr:hypothetical protein [Desulfuromonadales bacterium]
MSRQLLVIFLLLLLLESANSLRATDLDHLVFLKVAPEERLTVIKLPEGEMRLLGVGDQVTADLKIVDMAPGQVVLEGPGAFGPETIIVRLENGKQTIDRMQRLPLKQK